MAVLQRLDMLFTHLSLVQNSLAFPLAIAAILISIWLVSNQGDDLPELNPRKPLELTNGRRVAEFIENGKEMLSKGRSRFTTNPYRVTTEWGNVVVVPSEYVDELKNDSRMNFSTPVNDDSHSYIPGFQPFSSDVVVVKVVTKYLTKALNKLIKPLSQEATISAKKIFTDDPEWHSINPSTTLLELVARVSTRVFMGKELCANEKWIEASTSYTALAFSLSDTLRACPRALRPFVHWFMPSCWELRRRLYICRQILKPHIEWRKVQKAEAELRDERVTFDDSIEWFEKEYGPHHDPATKQILLSVVAIHTTTDLISQTMINIALHPELFKALREEVIRVLSSEGLKKTSLLNLRLMDSVLKESQRLKPSLLSTFRRLAVEDIKLSNGYLIKKGTRVVIDNTHMWVPDYYPDPEKFDGYRFLKKRDASEEDKNVYLVSTSASHMGFGHGLHACPGRFFAANEIKIALCHILLKYDWRLPEGSNPKPVTLGMTFIPDPNTTLLIRRRKEEIDFESLEY